MLEIGKLPQMKKATLDETKEMKKEVDRRRVAVVQAFKKGFSGKTGEIMLEELRRHSRVNFPNYENPNATYSKIGEQTLVLHIERILKESK